MPFGEYIPLSGLLKWVLPAMQNDPSMSGFSRGEQQQQPLSIHQQHLGAAICYEVAYPNLTRRNASQSDFLVTVSNDAWFTEPQALYSIYRWYECVPKKMDAGLSVPLNTGVTAFIDHQRAYRKTCSARCGDRASRRTACYARSNAVYPFK